MGCTRWAEKLQSTTWSRISGGVGTAEKLGVSPGPVPGQPFHLLTGYRHASLRCLVDSLPLFHQKPSYRVSPGSTLCAWLGFLAAGNTRILARKGWPMCFAGLLHDVPSEPVLPLHLDERKDRRSPTQTCLRSPHVARARMCLSRKIIVFTVIVFVVTATILSSRLPSRVRLLFQHRPKTATSQYTCSSHSLVLVWEWPSFVLWVPSAALRG